MFSSQRHVGQRARRAALRADDGLEVAAAEAVHQVVAHREAALLDDACGVDDRLHRRAVAHRGAHRIERRLGGRVQVAVSGVRLRPDRELRSTCRRNPTTRPTARRTPRRRAALCAQSETAAARRAAAAAIEGRR